MLDIYKMIYVNLIASSLLIISLFIYKYIYPRKKINLLCLLILISLLPLISIFRKGTYESGDLSIHIKFAMQFFENLTQGNLQPEWIARHCGGYGCPVYIYLFALPYYIISVLHFIGFSFLTSAKLLLSITYVFSGIGMYVWLKNELNEKAGFIASVFYLFAPYHLIDLSFRVSIGELVSFAILPFSFYLVMRSIETRRKKFFIMNGLSFALLILSHQVTSFICFPLLIIYGFYVLHRTKQNYTHIFPFLFSFIFGFMLSAFYWVPIILENKYIYYVSHNQIIFSDWKYFFYSPVRYGLLFQGHKGELYFNVGYIQWILIFLAPLVILKGKLQREKKILLSASLFFFLAFFFMMLNISKPIWDAFPFLQNFQFSWRLMLEVSVFTSIMAGIILSKIKRGEILALLIIVLIGSTILNWSNRKVMPNVDDKALSAEKIFDESPGKPEINTPKWVDIYKPWIGKNPKSPIEFLTGKGSFLTLTREIQNHEYIVNATTNVNIKENTFYYPGWELTANNHKIPINFNNKNYPGIITFNLEKGLYKIDLKFKDTNDRFVTKVISGFSLLSLLVILLYFKFFHRRR